MPPLGIETLLIAGLPENKLEIIDGKTPCFMAFAERDEAEATFDHWVATIGRWKRKRPATQVDGELRAAEVGGYELALRGRRIDVRVPLRVDVHVAFLSAFWDAELWPGGPAVGGTSWLGRQDVSFRLLRELRAFDHKGVYGRCDVMLTEQSSLAPEAVVFRPGTERWIGRRSYLRGVPALVVEILSPATRHDDLPGGRRARVLARAGVQRYWLIDPGARRVLTFRLQDGEYLPESALAPGDVLRTDIPGGPEIRVADLFEPAEPDPWPGGPAAREPLPDAPASLEHLLLCGHPLRRYEILEDHAPCVVAFRDEATAVRYFDSWCADAARLAGAPEPERTGTTFEAGPLRLWRDGRVVRADVHFPGADYVRLLEAISAG